MVSSYDFKIIINNLKQGNHFTVNSARSSNSYAMTDISGYGLSSHLIDMCLSSNLSCELTINENILINSNIEILKNDSKHWF